MANIHIYDVPDNSVNWALHCGRHFAKDCPDHVGVRDGCGYTNGENVPLYAYRTKSGRIVVRGQKETNP